jgi:hypothetical protein
MSAIGRLRPRNPWYDLEGKGAYRNRWRKRLTADLAFAVAIVACGLTAFAWVTESGILRLLP